MNEYALGWQRKGYGGFWVYPMTFGQNLKKAVRTINQLKGTSLSYNRVHSKLKNNEVYMFQQDGTQYRIKKI